MFQTNNKIKLQNQTKMKWRIISDLHNKKLKTMLIKMLTEVRGTI